MKPTSRKTVVALIRSSVTTTECVGAIGVKSASTTKVAKADAMARAAASAPKVRRARPVAGLGVNSAGVAWSTLAILVIEPQHSRQPHRALPRMGRISPLMLLYNNVAELRQLIGGQIDANLGAGSRSNSGLDRQP